MRTIRDKVGAWSWAREAAGELKAELAEWLEGPVGEPVRTAAGAAGKGKPGQEPQASAAGAAGQAVPVERAGNGPRIRRAVRLPLEPGGWWHQYVCPEHHAELLFDPREEDAVRFRCPHGCVLEGEPYRGAWLVFRHQAMARYALQAAAVYAADGEGWCAELAMEILAGYARQFPRYPVHPDAQPWMLKGRAFHQALTEAIWSTTLIRAYLLLKDSGAVFAREDEEALQTFFTMLEESMEQYRHILIHEKKNAENNYTAWLNASLACVYAAKGADESKIRTLLEGPGGFYHHLSIGVKPDSFEFEGSTYYHVFVLRAYLIAAEMCLRFGIGLYDAKGEGGQSMKGMLDVLVALSGDQGQLPALHDGPYNRVPFAREIIEVFETGLSVYGDRELLPVLASGYRYVCGQEKRTGLEALLYGSEAAQGLFTAGSAAARKSLMLADSGFAVLRHPVNPLSVQTDFGEHGGSHGHFDKLHVSILHRQGEVAPEMGTVPYGSALRLGWYATTASHNTVSIGGRSQAPHAAACTLFREDGRETCIRLRSEGAYPGTVLERHLLITEEVLVDWFRVETVGDGEAAIDWWLHPSAALALPEEGRTMLSPRAAGAEDGYAHAELTAQWSNPSGEARSVSWSLTGGGVAPGADTGEADSAVAGSGFTVHASTLLPAGAELFQIRTPGIAEDPSQRIGGLLLRQKGKTADFVTVYRPGGEQVNVEAVDAGAGLRVSGPSLNHTFALDPASGLIQKS